MMTSEEEDSSATKLLTVSVRFWDSRIAFGSYRYSKALVSDQFMAELSAMNQNALNTKHLLKTTNRISSRPTKMKLKEAPTLPPTKLISSQIDTFQASSSSSKMIPLVENEAKDEDMSAYRLLPPSTEPLSEYYDMLIALSMSRNNKSFTKAIDTATMSVNCTLDLWIWMHLQGYFKSLSLTDGRIWSILKLHDIGSKNWVIPVRKPPRELTREATLPIEGSPIMAALDLQQILLSKGSECTVENTLQLLQQSLFRHNRQLNEQLSVLRKRTFERMSTAGFDSDESSLHYNDKDSAGYQLKLAKQH